MECDLYQNPYRTRCSGSMSPDDEGLSVCWRHLQSSRDEWYARAQKAEAALRKIGAIRDNIIAFQNVSWSAHIYPLVAALNEAGVRGADVGRTR